MIPNHTFYKTVLVYDFLGEVAKVKQDLLNELLIYGSDPVVHMRRIRILAQLSEFESQVLYKIKNFQTNDPADYKLSNIYHQELQEICHRSS